MVVDGAMNGEIFLAYVEHCLVPTLRVVDNPPTDVPPFDHEFLR
jgi:hypothetical protein